ncbi:MAG: tRNA (adenosine(37)-N6)-threonylcarbamoyltransferase complex dimerization subunit type 1 TsaB [Actinomycetaceae bacterium]|nr:tRNA (adenosine(37)-N6)-threonylcarbamoyltransferase complex dimerization subunit type 1 TsaB [Actinomycetaceae bacterium]
MRFLCVDTSEGTALALVDVSQTATVLARYNSGDGRRQAEDLSAAIGQMVRKALGRALADSDIDAVVVGTGPASFTGLRAGIVSARVIAAALGIPAYGISSLQIWARSALDKIAVDTVTVATDAKRKEIFVGQYQADGADDVATVWGPEVGVPESFTNRLGGAVAVGSALALYPRELSEGRDGLGEQVDAAVLARIAKARLSSGTEMSLEPIYLRRPDIHPGVLKKLQNVATA